MTDFSLRRLVREVLDDTDAADPGELVDIVLASLTRSQIRAALEQSLRPFIREVITATRTRPPVTPVASSKVAAVRDGWQQRLHDRIYTSEGAWKLLGDCAYDDLLAAAAKRDRVADQNAARARELRAWARLLTEHEAETMRDLPVGVQAAALGRVA